MKGGCQICKFFVLEHVPELSNLIAGVDDEATGICRRWPPRASRRFEDRFPQVLAEDCCGEYRYCLEELADERPPA